MWLHSVHRHFYPWFSAACLTTLLLAACQPPAAPPATLAPTPSAPSSATLTAPTPTPAPTDTDLPPTAALTATPSPSPRPPIPTADFAPADFQGIWHRFDKDRGDLYLTFRADGTYSAAHGTTFSQVHGGTYTLEGRLFTFVTGWNCSPMEGTVVGSYLIRIINHGQFLYFDRYGDRCPDRPQALANFRWTRVIATPTPVP